MAMTSKIYHCFNIERSGQMQSVHPVGIIRKEAMEKYFPSFG